MKQFQKIYLFKTLPCVLFFSSIILSQTHIPADPYYLFWAEKSQFQGHLPMQSTLLRPVFFNTDSLSISFTLFSENYYNDNAPNQENMDVRYFSKGFGSFYSAQLAVNSPYFSFIAEPFLN